MLSPPLAESTKLSDKLCPDNSVSSENRKTSSIKAKRVRRNYNRFKIGHEVDKKMGWVDDSGRLMTVKDKVDALFKPKSENLNTPPNPVISSDDSPTSSTHSQEETALPPDPRYPELLPNKITDRDIYNCQRIKTRIKLMTEEIDTLAKVLLLILYVIVNEENIYVGRVS